MTILSEQIIHKVYQSDVSITSVKCEEEKRSFFIKDTTAASKTISSCF